MLIRKIHKQPAYFKWISSPSELLPEEANQLARDTIDLLELFGLIWLSGKVKGLERRALSLWVASGQFLSVQDLILNL